MPPASTSPDQRRSGRRSHPTVSDVELDPDSQYRSAIAGRRGRRITVAALCLLVAAGLSGRLGYRESTDATTSHGITTRLDRPSVTRGGLPTRWELTVRTVDGTALGGNVVVATSSGYFDVFDHNDLVPEPETIEQSNGLTTWTFDAADLPQIDITLDVRTQPDARWRHGATTTVSVGGRPVARFEYTTTVLP